MRRSIVGFIGLGAVAIAFAMPTNSSATERDGRPKCGGHGWVLNALDTSHIYDVDVDKQAVADRGNPKIAWPGTIGQNANGVSEADMKLAGNASVVGEFVVDTVGCVDSSSFKVVSSSDTAFTGAVLSMLPKLRYEPARKDGKKVRSRVLWKFEFYRQNGARAPTDH
ncbi:MAG: energy transducer TonB [Gemmatimonadaceae bacterium]